MCIRYPLRGVTNVLICNQSLIDFLSSVVFVFQYGILRDVILPTRGELFLCRVWKSEYVLWALGVSSTANLMYLTVERYMAVLHPIVYRNKFTPLIAKLVALLPWIIGLLHEIPWAMSHEIGEDGCSHQWWSDKVAFIIAVMAPTNHYILPLLLMAFVYTRIFLKLRSGPAQTTGKHDKGSSLTYRASRSVIKTMFVVSVTYLICWGPNEILYFYMNMGGVADLNGAFSYYTAVSALSNMCVNPFVYTFHYQDFRVKFGKMSAVFCPNMCLRYSCFKNFDNKNLKADSAIPTVSSTI